MTRASNAYRVVRGRIISGEMALGAPISRRRLASELGVSFLPITEALIRLELEGLVESRPRAGTRVRIPTPQEVRDHFVVREAFEAQAARAFAGVATPRDRSDVQRLARRVDELSERGAGCAVADAHVRLHRRILKGARCPSLRAAIEANDALASAWLSAGGQQLAGAVPPAARHRELASTLCTGSPDESAAAARQHVASDMHRVIALLEPYFRFRQVHAERFYRSASKQPRVSVSPDLR
jgi:DNA-binding GntR family transcriptional regulator